MKYKLHKSILTLLVAILCSWATAQGQVVTVHLCDETAPFLFGCEAFTPAAVGDSMLVDSQITLAVKCINESVIALSISNFRGCTIVAKGYNYRNYYRY